MFPEPFPNKQILDSSPVQFDNTIMEADDKPIDMSAKAIWDNEKGIFIKVVVKPNSKSKKFVAEITPDAIFLNLSGPAREGKANAELVKKVARVLCVPTSAIALVSGHKNREKTIFVKGITQATALEKLSVVI
jgi:uncharacterized protein (TIGR00251 family)